MSLIIAIDIAAFNFQVFYEWRSRSLSEETTIKTIDYTDLRKYDVFTKRPIRIILKTDVLSTWRTWTFKQNTWPPFDPIQSPRQQLIKNDHDRDLKWFLWRTLRVSTFRPWPCKTYHFNTSRTNKSCLIVCEFLKRSSYEIYVLKNPRYDQ